MNKDLEGKNPLFICILNGSFMFASDLMKQITVENAQITFMRLSSYEGTTTTGKVKKLMGFTEDLKDRTVVLLEDIVDTGITISNTLEQIKDYEAKEVLVATMLFKPDALIRDIRLDYVGKEIPNDFIVGRGLDYDGIGRNLPDIYTVID
jgi:hypoxanthine phosphoribosyltransferase